jgi:hypothetical protein
VVGTFALCLWGKEVKASIDDEHVMISHSLDPHLRPHLSRMVGRRRVGGSRANRVHMNPMM